MRFKSIGALRFAHRVESANDVLLPADDVERRQLAEPCGRGSSRFAADRSESFPCGVKNPNIAFIEPVCRRWLCSEFCPLPVPDIALIAASSS